MSADILLQKIDQVRRRQRSVAVGQGVAKTVLAALGLIMVFFLLDWLVLSRSTPGSGDRLARGILMLAILGTFAYVVWHSIVQEMKRHPDDDEVALKVEKGHPELKGRLISTIQLTRSPDAGGSKELIDALEADTIGFAGGMTFTDIISLEMVKKVALVSGALLLLAIALGAWRSDFAKAVFARMALSEHQYPTAARIVDVTEGGKVPHGEPFAISVELDPTGLLPETASVQIRNLAGRTSTLVLTRVGTKPAKDAKTAPTKPGTLPPLASLPSTGGAVYTGVIEHVLEDLEFRPGAHDALWPRWEKLTAVSRPAAKSLGLTYTFPEYLGRPIEKSSVGDIRAPEGSSVALTASFNKPVRKARLVRRDNQTTAAPVDMQLDAMRTAASFTLPVAESGFYRILLTCDDGLDNVNPIEYVIDAVKDRAPTAKITFPAQDKTVTRFARWPIRFTARDDNGIAKGVLKYRIVVGGKNGNGEQSGGTNADTDQTAPATSIDLAGLVQGKAQKEVGGEFFFDLKPLNVAPDSRVIYWIEMEDARRPVPNRGVSQPYVFAVVEVAVMQEMLDRDRNAVLESLKIIRDKEKDNRDGVDAIRRGLPAADSTPTPPGK